MTDDNMQMPSVGDPGSEALPLEDLLRLIAQEGDVGNVFRYSVVGPDQTRGTCLAVVQERKQLEDHAAAATIVMTIRQADGNWHTYRQVFGNVDGRWQDSSGLIPIQG